MNHDARKAKQAAHNRRWKAANPDRCREYNRAWKARNKEAVRAYQRDWAIKNPERYAAKNRRDSLRRKYKITPEQMEALLIAQGGRCAIGRETEPRSRRGWFVDHDHRTGKVRGVVCHHCNIMLGGARDNPDVLLAAIEYLEGNA